MVALLFAATRSILLSMLAPSPQKVPYPRDARVHGRTSAGFAGSENRPPTAKLEFRRNNPENPAPAGFSFFRLLRSRRRMQGFFKWYLLVVGQDDEGRTGRKIGKGLN